MLGPIWCSDGWKWSGRGFSLLIRSCANDWVVVDGGLDFRHIGLSHAANSLQSSWRRGSSAFGSSQTRVIKLLYNTPKHNVFQVLCRFLYCPAALGPNSLFPFPESLFWWAAGQLAVSAHGLFAVFLRSHLKSVQKPCNCQEIVAKQIGCGLAYLLLSKQAF